MDKQLQQLHQSLNQRLQHPDEQSDIEFWFARDLQQPLGYASGENYLTVINKPMAACEGTGVSVDDHFRGVTKMVTLGSGSERQVEDFMLDQRGIQPEHLPAEEDLKKLERRVKAEEKKLSKQTPKLPKDDTET